MPQTIISDNAQLYSSHTQSLQPRLHANLQQEQCFCFCKLAPPFDAGPWCLDPEPGQALEAYLGRLVIEQPVAQEVPGSQSKRLGGDKKFACAEAFQHKTRNSRKAEQPHTDSWAACLALF